jgi:hypothetical protein
VNQILHFLPQDTSTEWCVIKQFPLSTTHQVSKHVQFQCILPSGECQMVECKYVLWQSQKTLSRRVNSHNYPGKVIGPAFPNLHLRSSPKSSFISKSHQKWGHQLLIHQQNPHTQINQLAVTAKILSQPGIQLCVASVAVQSWQTDCQGLHERLPWLVQHSGLIWTEIILLIRQRLEKYFI